MTYYYQETDTRIFLPSPKLARYPIEPPNETIGRDLTTQCVLPTGATDIVKRARAKLQQIDNQDIVEEANRLFSTVQRITTSFRQFGFDLDHLPPLQTFFVEDGSVLVEWIFDDFRMGFGLDPNPEDSSWYLASTERLGHISAYGQLSSIDLEKLIVWLMSFALSQS